MSLPFPLFGIGHETPRDRPPDPKQPLDQIDVLPRSASSSPCLSPVLRATGSSCTSTRVGRGHEPLSLVEGEEVEIRLRRLQPLDLGHCFDQLSFLGDDQQPPQDGQVVVDRLLREPLLDLVRDVVLDLREPNPVEGFGVRRPASGEREGSTPSPPARWACSASHRASGTPVRTSRTSVPPWLGLEDFESLPQAG